MFSRTLSSRIRPSALRSSGQNAIPSLSERPGVWVVIGTPPTLRRPESARAAPKTSLATSVRPEPSSPASPTTSPERTERSNGAIRRRRPRPSATRIGSPFAVGRSRDKPFLGLLEFASQHQRDQFQRRQIRRRRRADQAAIAQDRDAVCDPIHLIDEVGDEDHCDSAPLQVPHDPEQEFGLVRVEARGRLVEHQNPSIVLERAGDRDQLLDGHGIRTERPLDVDVDVEPLQPLARELARRAPCNQSEPARLAAEGQVLGHRHRRNEIHFLVNRADAEGTRLAGRADMDRAAVEPNLAPIAAQGAGQDLDQRRLAGPVLAHERVNFAGLDPKVDPLQRPHARKGLRHPQHLDSRGQGFRPVVRPCGHELSPGRSHFTSLCPGDERAPPCLPFPALLGSGAERRMGYGPRLRARVGLHERQPGSSSSHTCSPLTIRPVGPPSPLRGEGPRASRARPKPRQLPAVAAVCRSDGIFTHFGSSSFGFFR